MAIFNSYVNLPEGTRAYMTGWWLSHPSQTYESMGRIISYIMDNKKCLKPPTSWGMDGLLGKDQIQKTLNNHPVKTHSRLSTSSQGLLFCKHIPFQNWQSLLFTSVCQVEAHTQTSDAQTLMKCIQSSRSKYDRYPRSHSKSTIINPLRQSFEACGHDRAYLEIAAGTG